MARVMVAFANKSSRDTSRRQKRKNLERAQAGLPHGSRRVFGYEPDLVTIRPDEAAILRAFAQRLLLGHTYKEIARWANAQGYVTTTGRSFGTLTIRHLLHNIRYGAFRDYNGERHKGSWEPIFDADTWQRLEAATRAKLQSPALPVARKYLLTGLVFCGKCEQLLSGGQRRQNGVITRAYWCRTNTYVEESRRGCGGIRRGADPLDDFITECIFFRLSTPELGKLLSNGEPTGALNDLLVDRQAQQRRLDGLVDDYATGLLTKDQLQRAKITAEAELRRIDDEIDRASRERMHVDLPVGETLRQVWDKSDSDEWRRNLVRLLIKRITVLPGGKLPNYTLRDGRVFRFDPSLVKIEWLA